MFGFDYLVASLFVTVNVCHLCHMQDLEKLASRKLRINAKETMRIAEKLYTQG